MASYAEPNAANQQQPAQNQAQQQQHAVPGATTGVSIPGVTSMDVYTVSVDAGNGNGIQVFDRVFWSAQDANEAARMFFGQWTESQGIPDWENNTSPTASFSKGEIEGNAWWSASIQGVGAIKVHVIRTPIEHQIQPDNASRQDHDVSGTDAAMSSYGQNAMMQPVLSEAAELVEFEKAAAEAEQRAAFASQQMLAPQQGSNDQDSGDSSPSRRRKAEAELLPGSPKRPRPEVPAHQTFPTNGIQPGLPAGLPGTGLPAGIGLGFQSGLAPLPPSSLLQPPRKRGPKPLAERMSYTNSHVGPIRPFSNYTPAPPPPLPEGMLQVWNWSCKGYGETMELATLGCHMTCKLNYIQTLTKKALVIRAYLRAPELNFIEVTHNFTINNVQPACDEFKKLCDGHASKIKFYVNNMNYKGTFSYEDLTNEEIKNGWVWYTAGPANKSNASKEKIRMVRTPPEEDDEEEEQEKQQAPATNSVQPQQQPQPEPAKEAQPQSVSAVGQQA